MKTFPFGSVTAISLFAPSVKSRLKQQLKLFPTIWQLNNACRNSHFNGPSTKVKKAQSVLTLCYTLLFLCQYNFPQNFTQLYKLLQNHSCFQSSVKSVYLILGPFVLFAQAALNTYIVPSFPLKKDFWVWLNSFCCSLEAPLLGLLWPKRISVMGQNNPPWTVTYFSFHEFTHSCSPLFYLSLLPAKGMETGEV